MGGTVVMLGERRFDADELWRLVEDHHVTQLSIVGDAFARPMVAALEAAEAAGRSYDLSSVQRIVSTGATLSADHKKAFQQRCGSAVIMDMIGASEGGPFAISMTMPGAEPTATRGVHRPAQRRRDRRRHRAGRPSVDRASSACSR